MYIHSINCVLAYNEAITLHAIVHPGVPLRFEVSTCYTRIQLFCLHLDSLKSD